DVCSARVEEIMNATEAQRHRAKAMTSRGLTRIHADSISSSLIRADPRSSAADFSVSLCLCGFIDQDSCELLSVKICVYLWLISPCLCASAADLLQKTNFTCANKLNSGLLGLM